MAKKAYSGGNMKKNALRSGLHGTKGETIIADRSSGATSTSNRMSSKTRGKMSFAPKK
jgi:hypothetical protein